MFEPLTAYRAILVTGPQRSGTRICAKMIAADTGFRFVDETELRVADSWKLGEILKYDTKFVAQCPGLSYCIEDFEGSDVLIVFMMRPLDQIISSQKRINWGCEWKELRKYGTKRGPIAAVKYEVWPEQRKKIKHWLEVEYSSLRAHPLWVDEEKRKKFKAFQTA